MKARLTIAALAAALLATFLATPAQAAPVQTTATSCVVKNFSTDAGWQPGSAYDSPFWFSGTTFSLPSTPCSDTIRIRDIALIANGYQCGKFRVRLDIWYLSEWMNACSFDPDGAGPAHGPYVSLIWASPGMKFAGHQLRVESLDQCDFATTHQVCFYRAAGLV
jgi:hypothetical protein